MHVISYPYHNLDSCLATIVSKRGHKYQYPKITDWDPYHKRFISCKIRQPKSIFFSFSLIIFSNFCLISHIQVKCLAMITSLHISLEQTDILLRFQTHTSSEWNVESGAVYSAVCSKWLVCTYAFQHLVHIHGNWNCQKPMGFLVGLLSPHLCK